MGFDKEIDGKGTTLADVLIEVLNEISTTLKEVKDELERFNDNYIILP